MSDELRSAAERLLRWAERHADDPNATREAKALIHDAGKVAIAYLAEHPADDDEPVTSEWMKSIGTLEVGQCIVCAADPTSSFFVYLHVEGVAKHDSLYMLPTTCKTRGDVRRLLAALGIEVPK